MSTEQPAKVRILAKIKVSQAKFRARDYLGAAALLDDAAHILKQAGQWSDSDPVCASIVSLRATMAAKAELANQKDAT